MKTVMFTAAFTVMMLISFGAVSQVWELDKNEDGIEVYTRKTEGSLFKAFKASVEISALPDDILAVLKDADNYVSWFGYTKTSKLLKRDGSAQYNYVETSFPWPYDNRDMVYRMAVEKNGSERIKITLTGMPDYIPEKDGIVRMKKAEGYILLDCQRGITTVSYYFHSEPGGDIPSWLANSSISELPYETLSGLRNILKK